MLGSHNGLDAGIAHHHVGRERQEGDDPQKRIAVVLHEGVVDDDHGQKPNQAFRQQELRSRFRNVLQDKQEPFPNKAQKGVEGEQIQAGLGDKGHEVKSLIRKQMGDMDRQGKQQHGIDPGRAHFHEELCKPVAVQPHQDRQI